LAKPKEYLTKLDFDPDNSSEEKQSKKEASPPKSTKKNRKRRSSNKENENSQEEIVDPLREKFFKTFCVHSTWIGSCLYDGEEKEHDFELTINDIKDGVIEGTSVWPNLKAKTLVKGEYSDKKYFSFKDVKLLEGDLNVPVEYKFNLEENQDPYHGNISDGEKGSIVLYSWKEYQNQKNSITKRRRSTIDSDSSVEDLVVPSHKEVSEGEKKRYSRNQW